MKKIIGFFLLLFCNFSCKKVDYNIDSDKIFVLGHGGMGISSIYPLNSLEAISYCLNLKSDGSEFDVQMTKDSVLVAFHDVDLSDKTNVSGEIYQKNWNEISHAKYKFPLYADYKVINLDLLFSNLGEKIDKLFILDCKDYNPDTSAHYRNTFCNALIKIIDKYNIQNNVIIELKQDDVILTLKQKNPKLKIFACSGAGFDKAYNMASQYSLQGIDVPVDRISKEQVSIAHQAGFEVAVFNVNSQKKNIEAIEKKVDIVETDKLKHLLRLIK